MGLRKLYYQIKGFFNVISGKVSPSLYMDEIEEHFEKLFGVKDSEEHVVFHELASELVHIDVHVLKPTEERPFHVLFTTGMSDRKMTFDEDAPWDFKKLNERAELFCLLPPDWVMDVDGMKENEAERWYWVIRALKSSARFPHMYETALGNAHSMSFSEENEPFADNTALCSAVFIKSDEQDFDGKYGEDVGSLTTKDNTYINLLCFIPIYKEELDFKLENGGIELFKRLFGDTISSFDRLIIDPCRENVCLEK